MSEPAPISHPKQRPLSTDVAGFDALAELDLDMRSSWNHATGQVWRQLAGAASGHAYCAEVPATRPATGYPARVIPRRDDVTVPLESPHILWQQ